MICWPLVKNAQVIKDGPEMYSYLVASAVMFSLSGFNAYLMAIKMMKYEYEIIKRVIFNTFFSCDKKADTPGEVSL